MMAPGAADAPGERFEIVEPDLNIRKQIKSIN
jgi:hypothetical protein